MSDSFGTFIDGIKKLTQLKKELSDLEFQKVIMDLQSELLEAQAEMLKLKAENLELKQNLDEALQSDEMKKSLIEVEGFKYDSVDGIPKGFPYCPICEVKEGNFYRLTASQNPNRSICQNCRNIHRAVPDGAVNVIEPKSPQPSKIKSPLSRRRF